MLSQWAVSSGLQYVPVIDPEADILAVQRCVQAKKPLTDAEVSPLPFFIYCNAILLHLPLPA